ncbi:MAG: sulfatase-like hydrolase/transferase [Phycisphaerales bacterium]|nr:sulfatase-like hydrolase/transferase [Phycisphaerales bacterium]
MPNARPNVIVFFTDQQRHDSIGLHGNPLDLTPNFDRFATEGTHLFNTFTCQPVCGPARACLQTGLYATASGAYRNDVLPDPSHKMLGQYFHDAGYHTGYIGKWHLASRESMGPVAPEQRGGYDYWLASNVLEFTSDAYRCNVFDAGGKRVRLPGYRVDALTDAAIRYIDREQSHPFFLFVSYIEPHFQNHRDDYPAPDGYRERYQGRWTPPDLQALGGTSARDLGGYWGMCRRLDEAFGRLCESVKSLGLWDNTAILFTSDHACHFKTRNSEYKRSCHESSIRVPGALGGGGLFQNGGRLPQLVSLIDFPPTLLDVAGIEIPSTMQGRSLLPLVQRRADTWPDDVFVQISESQVARAIRTSRWKYSVTAPDKNGWKDMNSTHYVEECLYDLYADPYELTNLVGYESHRPLSDILRNRLITRMLAAGESEPTITPAPPIKSGQRRVENVELNQ